MADYSLPPAIEMQLWDAQVPLALGNKDEDHPSLKLYMPKQPSNRTPVLVIFPGGGYNHLANHEGDGYAQWFLSLGFACAVVKYRLGSQGYRHPAMLVDAARSIRLVRKHADQLGLDPNRVGVIGSSAGGHLVATLITHKFIPQLVLSDPVDSFSSLPNFAILCYPVISMVKYPHQGSRQFLLGEETTAEQLLEASPENHVSPQTPPCFIWHTTEDERVSVNHSLLFASSLQQNSVPFELHIYQKGSHGIGLANGHPWTGECRRWLQEYGFIES
jgi:acetyl esterase/lipase